MVSPAEWRAALEHMYSCTLETQTIKRAPAEQRKKIACIAAVEMLIDKFKEQGETLPEHVRQVCKEFMAEIKSGEI